MSTKHKAAKLISTGMQKNEVADALGVDASYITQLEGDDEYARILAELQAQSGLASHSISRQIDTRYNSIEHKIVETIDDHSDAILGMMIDKPSQLIGLMKAVNGAKRRSSGETIQQHAHGNQVVEVQLPAFIVEASVPQVQHNSANEVVAVGDRDLVSLSGTGLKKQLQAEKAAALALPTNTTEALATLDLRS